jgi:hypothetical protein
MPLLLHSGRSRDEAKELPGPDDVASPATYYGAVVDGEVHSVGSSVCVFEFDYVSKPNF